MASTAVAADVSRQIFTTMPVTHYFDVKRVCRGCQRPFLFFADEQKHWYEELGFSIGRQRRTSRWRSIASPWSRHR
jgi:hypothetical protein